MTISYEKLFHFSVQHQNTILFTVMRISFVNLTFPFVSCSVYTAETVCSLFLTAYRVHSSHIIAMYAQSHL